MHHVVLVLREVREAARQVGLLDQPVGGCIRVAAEVFGCVGGEEVFASWEVVRRVDPATVPVGELPRAGCLLAGAGDSNREDVVERGALERDLDTGLFPCRRLSVDCLPDQFGTGRINLGEVQLGAVLDARAALRADLADRDPAGVHGPSMRSQQVPGGRQAVGILVLGLSWRDEAVLWVDRHRPVCRYPVALLVRVDDPRLVDEVLQSLAEVQLLEDRPGIAAVTVRVEVFGEVVDAPAVDRHQRVARGDDAVVRADGTNRPHVRGHVLRRDVADVGRTRASGHESVKLFDIGGVRHLHELVEVGVLGPGVLGVRDKGRLACSGERLEVPRTVDDLPERVGPVGCEIGGLFRMSCFPAVVGEERPDLGACINSYLRRRHGRAAARASRRADLRDVPCDRHWSDLRQLVVEVPVGAVSPGQVQRHRVGR